MVRYEVRYIEFWPVVRITLFGGLLAGILLGCLISVLVAALATTFQGIMGDPVVDGYGLTDLFANGGPLPIIMACGVGLALLLTVKAVAILMLYNLVAAITGGVRMHLTLPPAASTPSAS